jgi:hypothetical protein
MEASTKVGLEAVLALDNCVLVLIDHQLFQLTNVHSHEPTMVMDNATALANTAQHSRTISTTVNEERGGPIFKTVQDLFPNHTSLISHLHQGFEGHKRCPRREEHGPDEARCRHTLVADASCNTRYLCDG